MFWILRQSVLKALKIREFKQNKRCQGEFSFKLGDTNKNSLSLIGWGIFNIYFW
ncbi:hypothetical protein HMPREF9700_00784 [Bergeyella zoohelcum CCUG 30536]|uniref:Uncharacterized protein n=1 Tax=Bergeyella zoohelcum TaxID=1015 RepID=A0A376BYQ2_9FLAO|nr:hypothetical protein HMPREF9700_00784 [Bergeyella zoohelcum CCUG 30536]SSZ46619.1 Uncharacterised protein [Bergeyella zoohelcum]